MSGADNLYQRITEGQAHDEVIKKALKEIAREGRVVSGQLKNISNRLRATNGMLYFMRRIVVPTVYVRIRYDSCTLSTPRTGGNVIFITENFLLATNGTQCGSFLQRLCDLPESQAQIQRKSTDGGNENWTRDPWGGNGNGHRYTTMDGLAGRGYR